MNNKAEHWENIYKTKGPNEVSWTQELPLESLQLIKKLASSKSDSIIDIGGGDSKLVDCLLDDGYKHLSVLDISSFALNKAQNRLAELAKAVEWIHSDVVHFKTDKTYEIWHDRAAFHFLTNANDIEKYVSIVNSSVTKYLIISGFAPDGPAKCSGLDVSRHHETNMKQLFSENFELIESFHHTHITPFKTEQKFLFSVFHRRS